MNIAFLLRLWPSYGGGETVTKCLANEFIRRGHGVYVVYFKENNNEGDSIKADPNIVSHRIDGIRLNEFSNEFFVNKKEAKIANKELTKYVKRNHIEIVINQWWPVEFIEGLKGETGTIIIKCLHTDPNTKKVFEFSGWGKKMFDFIEPLYRKIETQKHLYSSNKYLRNSDKYIFLSPSFLKYYRENSKERKRIEKTDFVFNPLVFEDYITKEDFNTKENRVLFVGRLVEQTKKVSRILHIWKRFESEYHNNWFLDIVGDGPDKERYEKFVNQFDLKRVKFYGFQDPKPFYRRASIFLMTSAYEGWPMTIVESMQNGVIPICMNTFLSVNDIIDNRHNGVIVPDSDEDAFYKEMINLMYNPDQRKIMAIRGVDNCKNYTVDKIVNKWEDIFKELKSC